MPDEGRPPERNPDGPVRGGRASRSSGRRRRWVALGVGGGLIGVLLLAGVVVLGLSRAYHTYRLASGALPLLEQGRAALARGEIPAGDPLGRAASIAATAEAQMRDPGFALRVVEALPFVDRPALALRDGVAGLYQDAEAGLVVRNLASLVLGSGSDSNARDGGSALFSHGAVNVGLLAELEASLLQVQSRLVAGQADFARIPSVPFVAQVAALRDRALVQSRESLAVVDRALAAVRVLPGFLGAHRPMTYFVALQNNADQRATGGAVLAYALVRFTDGRMTLLRGGPILSIESARRGVPVPMPPAVRWYLRNARVPPRIDNGPNYSPDFPVVASVWARQVERSTGRHVDGVVAVDPFGVAAALTGEPAIRVASYPAPIRSADVASLTEQRQFLLPAAEQVPLAGELIDATFGRIAHPTHPLSMLRALSEALALKHVQLWSADPVDQRLFTALGWAGTLTSPPGDYLYLTDDKRVSNKVDFYTQQVIRYAVVVRSTGTVSSTCAVRLANRTPSGLPRSVVGPWSRYALNVAMLNLYVPGGAVLQSVNPRVSPSFKNHAGFFAHSEAGHRVFTQTIDAWPGHPGNIVFRYLVPHAILPTSRGELYQLTVQHQPLAHPASLTVVVRLPAGAHIRSASPGWVVRGDMLTLHVVLVGDFQTQILFTG